MTELEQLQLWFQAAICHPQGPKAGAESAQAIFGTPGDSLETIVTRSRSQTIVERLEIYANAYFTRLIECLGEVFPISKGALGTETFDAFAFGYLQRFPSRSYTLNELGRNFSRYLAETRPAVEVPTQNQSQSMPASETLPANWPDFLIELVRFEWALNEVFDAPGPEMLKLLDTNDVLAIDPSYVGSLRLKTIPGLQLLQTNFPVNRYYGEARQATQPPSIPSAAESWVALYRRDYIVRRLNLSAPEFEVLKAIQAGAVISEALSRAESHLTRDVEGGTVIVTAWFRRWTLEGLFESIL